MKKKIAYLHENEFLKTEVEKYTKSYDHLRERVVFIKKQADDFCAEMDTMRTHFWSKLEKYCEDNNLLPSEYKKDTWSISYDTDLGVLFCEETEEEPSLSETLRKLMKE